MKYATAFSHRLVLMSAGVVVTLAAAACGDGPPPQAGLQATGGGGAVQDRPAAAVTVADPAGDGRRSQEPPQPQPVAMEAVSGSASRGPVAMEAVSGSASRGPVGAIGWHDLLSLAFAIGGEAVQLERGHGTVWYDDPHGGWSERYDLGETVGRGDLNGDGRDDLAALVEHRPGGSGVFSYLVPVLDDDGTAAARDAVFLGDRIIVEDLSVRNGQIEVSMLDRTPEDPYIVLSQRKTLEIDLSVSPPAVTQMGIVPLPDGPQYAP